MHNKESMVFIVDDDPSILASLKRLVRSVDLAVETFASPQEFLQRPVYSGPGCLVLDVRMPQLSGLDLQDKMAEMDNHTPIVFITGHGTISMSVKAMKKGAVDFIEKPFNDQDLLDAIQYAIEENRQQIESKQKVVEIQQREKMLTPREQQVFRLVVQGWLNKQIAYELEISEKTVKIHRSNVMQKMQAESVSELVRMAEKIGVFSKDS